MGVVEPKGGDGKMMRGFGPYTTGTPSADWGQMNEFMRQMMWPYQSGWGRTFWEFHWVLGLITWVLVAILLIGVIRWVWKKGNK